MLFSQVLKCPPGLPKEGNYKFTPKRKNKNPGLNLKIADGFWGYYRPPIFIPVQGFDA